MSTNLSSISQEAFHTINPLFDAVKKDNIEEVEALIEHGANPNLKDKIRQTPLHLAAYLGKTKVVKVLLEHGANPNLQDKYGRTPLHMAAALPKAEVTVVLLEYGAKSDLQYIFRRTSLNRATDYGSKKVIKVSLAHSSNPYLQDEIRKTLLQIAAQYNRSEIIEIFKRFLEIKSFKKEVPDIAGNSFERLITLSVINHRINFEAEAYLPENLKIRIRYMQAFFSTS